MRFLRSAAGVLLFVGIALPVALVTQEKIEPQPPFDQITPDALRDLADHRLAEGQAILKRLLAVRGQRTIENTLEPYDDLFRLDANNNIFNFLSTVHPDTHVRAVAAEQFRRVRTLRDSMHNARVFQALSTIDLHRADAETRFYVERVTQELRAEGLDRDEATRRKVQALRAKILELEQEFRINLHQSTELVFANPAELEGVPANWLARQRRGATGAVIVDREFDPVARFARNPATRERAVIHQNNQAAANHVTLERLIKARHDLAVVMGHRTSAEHQFKNYMVHSPERVMQFLDTVRTLAEPALQRDYARALELLRREQPDLAAITMRDRAYAQRLFNAERASIDLTRVREYFPYDRVRDGVFRLSRELFDVEFSPAPDARVWESSVEAYDVFDKGRRIARVYLDTSDRENRLTPTNGSMHPFSLGARDSVAQAALAGRFKRAEPGDPSLMEPLQVYEFFHEFGHVLNFVLGMRRWAGTSGQPAEWDFVETPSIFFEQWAHDPDVLGTFARHYQTGEPMPPDIAALFKMSDDSANTFRLPIALWQARLSVALHNQTGPVDADAIVRDTLKTFPFPAPVAEIHPEASFTHLGNYAAGFYVYLWDDVIARDLRTRFERGLLDRNVAQQFRRTVLEAGGSLPATQIIQNFLGRPFSVDAWARWVSAAKKRHWCLNGRNLIDDQASAAHARTRNERRLDHTLKQTIIHAVSVRSTWISPEPAATV